MIINLSTIKSVFVGLKTLFQNAFKETPSNWEKVAMKVTSDSSEEDYWWLDDWPSLKKWIGEKIIKALKAHKYTLVNDDFEATVSVKRNHIKDGKLGGYQFKAQQAGKSAKEWPDQLVFGALSLGFTAPCYDKQPFFDHDHAVGGKSVSNKGTKKLSVASAAAAKASYGAARKAMRNFKNDEGVSLKIRPNLLVVPPALEDEARALLENDKFENGDRNIYKGTAEYLVSDDLESDDEWFLLDTNQIIKPLVFQLREEPDFVSQTDLTSDDVFNKAEYKFGVEARGAAGYGFWQMAYGSTGEDA